MLSSECHLQLEATDGPKNKNMALHDTHVSKIQLCMLLKLHKFLVKINFAMCISKNVKCSKKTSNNNLH